MAFEIETPAKAKLIEVEVLSQKNRQPDEDPGVKLTIEAALPNYFLSQFDGFLKSALFSKGSSGAQTQTTLDGVEVVTDMPSLSGVGAHVKTLKWDQDMTGHELVIDLGLGGRRSNLELSDCKLYGWRITPKEGGTVSIRFCCECGNASADAFAKLAKLKSRDISITIAEPEVVQEEIEEEAPARRGRRRRGAEAVAQH